jgi:hypothetical protein
VRQTARRCCDVGHRHRNSLSDGVGATVRTSSRCQQNQMHIETADIRRIAEMQARLVSDLREQLNAAEVKIQSLVATQDENLDRQVRAAVVAACRQLMVMVRCVLARAGCLRRS